MADQACTRVVLPSSWPACVRSALLHTISLARVAIVSTRGWAADSPNARVRLKVQNDRLRQEVALQREELRIKDARMALIAAHQRPHYPPGLRMQILELKTARGWNVAQAARAFLVTAATIAAWLRRVDESGPEALVQLPQPINRFPDFARHAVQRLKTLCPSMGKVQSNRSRPGDWLIFPASNSVGPTQRTASQVMFREKCACPRDSGRERLQVQIARTLARAGLHLGVSTVGRILADPPQRPPLEGKPKAPARKRVVTAKRPNHVWHVDLTAIPTSGGYWTTWLPGSLPQLWPFCWWIGVAVDHYSRRVMGVAVFPMPPSSVAVRAFLGRAVSAAGQAPRHLVCDKGSQFWCEGFKSWCRRRSIKPRFGAVGQHGSIAVVERLIKTLKYEGLHGLLVPFRYDAMRRELLCVVGWYNGQRPHTTLKGRTPDEVYFRRFPANRKPRIEPRPNWRRGSPCATPQTLVAGRPGDRFRLDVRFVDGNPALPIVRLHRAA